ncbi:hypothetical protein Q8A67_011853 [Cirrhinus molitorella]|uniref:Uncharacterized protein n=1 Tax=Cirrhinus molitorella TaxID=172907 RepID=A0AA88PLA5_9TELE|nr:hypothetical protein Q8A67_011853 [Cirrhinus molitorella]
MHTRLFASFPDFRERRADGLLLDSMNYQAGGFPVRQEEVRIQHISPIKTKTKIKTEVTLVKFGFPHPAL